MKKYYKEATIVLVILMSFIQNSFSQVISLDPTFNPPIIKRKSTSNNGNATITCIVQQADGKLILGGNIDSVNGVAVNGIVRLNTNGSVDPTFNFNPPTSYLANNGPKIKLIEGGKMLVTGMYVDFDSTQVIRGADFICLNNDGSLNSGFHAGISGSDGFDVQNDGKIIVVGNFSRFYENGNYVNIPPGIIRLNANGSRDLSFQAGTGFHNLISGGVWIDNITVLSNGKYLAGGKFSIYNGKSSNNFVRINSNGSYDSTFNIGTGFDIQTKKSIELSDGKYLIAGDFNYFNQAAVGGIVRLNSNGSRDTSFFSGIPFNIINEMIRKPDGKILLGYDVVFGVTGYPRGIIQLNENGTRDNSFNVGNGINQYGDVESICVQSDNNVMVGGYFTSYNNIATNPIIRLRVCGGGLRDTVYACNSYAWNGTSYSTSGIYTQTINLANGCSRVDTLQVFINSAKPASPSITQSLVSNTCGARVYRYTASSVTNTAGYSWILPGSVGGVSGVTIDSGNINYSRIIKLKYVSNEAAIAGDTIRVRAFSGCGQSALRAAKLINTKLSVPAAPASITITPMQTNVCGARRYRYTAPTLPIATTSATAATGYVWSFIGNLTFEGFSIDSGSLNSQKLVIIFSSNAAAVSGDSVRLYYTSACGNSLTKSSKLSNTVLNPPAVPTSLTITSLGASSCGQPRYRYVAPSLPAATTTTGAATGYNWSLLGQWQFGTNAVIDSGLLTSQKIVIRYLNGNVKVAGDSIRCMYSSACGFSRNKVMALTNNATGNAAPAKPTSITIAVVDTSICGGRKYRYTAPTLPAATSVYTAATGYTWALPVTDIGAILDSGILNSKVIVVRYTNNRAAIAGDSMYLTYSSACGTSAVKGQRLTNLLKAGCNTTAKKNNESNNVFVDEKNIAVVYPNPSNTSFSIMAKSSQASSVGISIMNMQGRCLKKITTTTNRNIQFGEELLPGVYFIQFEFGGTSKTVRVVKY